MFSSLTIAVLALASAALAANTQPASTLSVTTRNGRQGEFRIINRAVAASGAWFFSQNGNSSQLFTSASLKFNATIGSAPSTQVGGTVNAGVATDFFKVDTGAAGSLQVVVVSPINETLPICQFAVGDASRTTVVVRTTLTAGTPITRNGVCTLTGSTDTTACSQVTVANDAKVTFTCSVVVDTLATTRSCLDQPVRFYNFLTPTCDNAHLERTDVDAPPGTKNILNAALPTGDSSANPAVVLNRQQTFKLAGTALALETDSRFTDVILGATFDVKTFKTAFLNVVNVAFRTTGATGSAVLNNTFTYVIAEGTSTTLAATNVVHIQENFGPTAVSGWIEVRAGVSYTVFVFSAGTTEPQIFGDNGIAMPTAPTAVPLGPATTLVNGMGTTIVLAVNEMRIIRIKPSSNPTDGSAPLVNNVPLNGTDVKSGTKFVSWNQLGAPITIASPSDTACNLQFAAVNTDAPFSFTTDTNTGALSIFGGAAKCSALGDKLTPATFQYTHSGGSTCTVQGAFVTGRPVTRPVLQSCVESTTCNVNTAGIAKITAIADQEGFDLVQTLAVPLCNCAPNPATTPDCDVCQSVGEVLSSVEATRAAVLSASAASTSLSGTIRSQITAVQTSFLGLDKKLKKLDKTVRNIDDDVSDLVKAAKKKN